MVCFAYKRYREAAWGWGFASISTTSLNSFGCFVCSSARCSLLHCEKGVFAQAKSVLIIEFIPEPPLSVHFLGLQLVLKFAALDPVHPSPLPLAGATPLEEPSSPPFHRVCRTEERTVICHSLFCFLQPADTHLETLFTFWGGP